MALSEIDRNLLERCLSKKPKAWEDFVDRYMGLVLHVINHSAQCRSMRLTNEDREDLAGEVFLGIVRDQFAVLRHFRGDSSLATYLTVVTRRIVVQHLLKRKAPASLVGAAEHSAGRNGSGIGHGTASNGTVTNGTSLANDDSGHSPIHGLHTQGRGGIEHAASSGELASTLGTANARGGVEYATAGGQTAASAVQSAGSSAVERVDNADEIARLLDELEGSEAEIVRMYHLEGKTYGEISSAVGMPENSIGPTLSRARQKMRRVGAE